MQKLLVKFRPYFGRIVALCSAFVLLVACFSVDAKAWGIYEDTAYGTRWYSQFHGSIFVRLRYDEVDNAGDMTAEVDMPIVYGDMPTSNAWYVNDTGVKYNRNITPPFASTTDYICNFEYSTRWANQRVPTSIWSPSTYFYRMESDMSFIPQTSIGGRAPITEYTFNFDPLYIDYDTNYLANAFWVSDQGHMYISGVAWYVNVNGGFGSYSFGTNLRFDGNQSPFTGALRAVIADNCDYVAGDPCLITNLTVRVVPDDGNRITFHTLAGSFNRANPTLLSADPVYRFFGNPAIQPSPADGSGFVGWLANVADSFFNVELFGSFSFGDMLGILLAVSVVFWLLKLFAGG